MANDGAPLEGLVLNCTQFQKTYMSRDERNRAGSPEVMGYDIEKAKVL